MKNEDEKNIEFVVAQGVVEAVSTDTDGTYIRLRMVPQDATRLMNEGAFGRTVQVRFVK